MKRKIIKILGLFLIILLTGCSGNYNININEDMSIDEELYLTIENKDGIYQKTLDIFQKNNISRDDYNVTIKEDEIEITYKDNFDTIENYLLESKVYHQMFDNIEFNKTGDYIDLYVDENINIKNDITELNGSNLIDFDMIQLNINNPFEVNFSNADIVNENTYTWTITKNDLHKKLQIQFKPKLNIFPYREVIVGSVIVICFAIIIINIFKRYKRSQKV